MMEEQQHMPEGSRYYSKKVSGMMTRLVNPDEHLSLRRDVQPDTVCIKCKEMCLPLTKTNCIILRFFIQCTFLQLLYVF